MPCISPRVACDAAYGQGQARHGSWSIAS